MPREIQKKMFSQTGGKKEMKKLWIVLISLAMVAAFCMPASAVDVKFSGSYYVAGDYYNLKADDDNGYGGDWSTAFFRQRLRVQTEFVVSPGLSLITRFDALEKIWGDNNWAGPESNVARRPHVSEGYGESESLEQENIEFEQAYIQYMSKVGMWWIGYAPHDFWGTTFGDSTQTQALIQWILPMKWGMIGAKYFKTYEGSSTAFNGERGTDQDDNAYVGIAMYKTKDIETGMKVAYRRAANNKDYFSHGGQYDWQEQALPPGATLKGWLLTPYFIGQFGPVKFQAEAEYFNGSLKQDEGIPFSSFGLPYNDDDMDLEFLSTYLDATAVFGPAYFGGRFIYASGDDWKDGDDKIEGSNFSSGFEGCWGGKDLKQTLILWNEDVTNWVGNYASLGPGVKNAYFYQVYGGYKWQDFDFFASVAYAKADEYEYSDQDGKDYGWEFDATATYSITNNLKYMVGVGYLKAGDYFKDDSTGDNWVDDVYVLTNKLTLTF
jgi:hypothetical protein